MRCFHNAHGAVDAVKRPAFRAPCPFRVEVECEMEVRRPPRRKEQGRSRMFFISVHPRDPAYARFASFGGFESAEARSAKAESGRSSNPGV